jgi:pyruvate ferredoxin oxidoreductase beta subunit
MSWIKELDREGGLLPGTSFCAGCGGALSLRLALRVLGKRTVLVIPANCISAAHSYPKTAFKIPVLNVAFASAPAVASGLLAALKVREIRDVTVVVWAGDGGTADIGLQALSGAAHRKENILYVCYDNEGYMNTGVQESGATPFGALTTTSTIGKKEFKKNLPFIMKEHDIPYIATANVSYPQDYIQKLRKALTFEGLKYIHLLSPCPPGWRIPADETIDAGRLAVETGAWALFEIENGLFRLSGPSAKLLDEVRRKPIEEYLKIQQRFSKMTPEDIDTLRDWINSSWRRYAQLQKME